MSRIPTDPRMPFDIVGMLRDIAMAPYKGERPCPYCLGSGNDPLKWRGDDALARPCPLCNGSGVKQP